MTAARVRRGMCALAWGTCTLIASAARGDTAPRAGVIDAAVVRFYAPETGGAAYPRFVFGRVLAFEARLAAMMETPEGIGESFGERELRDAIEHHVAEEMLSSLADGLIADSAPDKRPSAHDLAEIERSIGDALVEELGGRERIDRAASAEQIDRSEVDAILRRAGLAAWYIDRAIVPLLHPSEQQLHDVFRTSAHPYRGRSFDEVHAALERWFVVERLRVAEGSFLQGARSRVRIVMTS